MLPEFAIGSSLGRAFCGAWIWVERHYDDIMQARRASIRAVLKQGPQLLGYGDPAGFRPLR